MTFDIVTIFPEMFTGPFGCGILKRAQNAGRIRVRIHQLRDFADPPHRKVDDVPYGGGGGMVFRPEPLFRAVEHVRGALGAEASRVVLTSPQGRRLDVVEVRRLSRLPGLVLLCGRYEGVDERVREHLVDEELSIGDYILSGGELAAMVVVDAVARHVEGVVGTPASLHRDSFVGGILDAPRYTRPEVYRGMAVPEVLRSGNHAAIESWRRSAALRSTRRRRPDLLDGTGGDSRAARPAEATEAQSNGEGPGRPER